MRVALRTNGRPSPSRHSTSTGAATRGEIEADDKQTVASQLRAKGLIVLDIEEQKPTDVGDLFARFKKVKAAELTVATRQLSTMISSGMSLLRALYVLEDQAENEKLRTPSSRSARTWRPASRSPTRSRATRHLQRALRGHGAAGESGGILEETLHRVADQLEKDDSLRRQVKSAMVYPT